MTVIKDEVDAFIATLESGEFYVTEMKVTMNHFKQSNFVTATVVPDPESEFESERPIPDQDEEAQVVINGYRIFTGFIQSVVTKENNSMEFNIVNDLYTVMNEEVTISNDSPVPLSKVISNVCDNLGIEYKIELTWQQRVTRGFLNIGQAADLYAQLDETRIKFANLLEKFAELTNSDWWFDRDNVLHLGIPDSKLYDTEYIFDSTATDKLPPYKGVRVIGAPHASDSGWGRTHMLANTSGVARVGLFYENGQWKREKGRVNQPMFTVKDKTLDTQQQVEQTAAKLADELFTQTKGGTIKFVGTQHKESVKIRPTDVIEMPEDMGGERYFIGEIRHKINDSDGYIVEVDAKGLVPGRYNPTESITVRT